MNPNLMEQFLGPSTQFFRFNQNDVNIAVTPIDKKTCLLTKRNVIATTLATSAALAAINNANNNMSSSSNSSSQANYVPSTSSTNLLNLNKIESEPAKLNHNLAINSTYINNKLNGAMKTYKSSKSGIQPPSASYSKLASSSYTVLTKSNFLDDSVPDIAEADPGLNNYTVDFLTNEIKTDIDECKFELRLMQQLLNKSAGA